MDPRYPNPISRLETHIQSLKKIFNRHSGSQQLRWPWCWGPTRGGEEDEVGTARGNDGEIDLGGWRAIVERERQPE